MFSRYCFLSCKVSDVNQNFKGTATVNTNLPAYATGEAFATHVDGVEEDLRSKTVGLVTLNELKVGFGSLVK